MLINCQKPVLIPENAILFRSSPDLDNPTVEYSRNILQPSISDPVSRKPVRCSYLALPAPISSIRPIILGHSVYPETPKLDLSSKLCFRPFQFQLLSFRLYLELFGSCSLAVTYRRYFLVFRPRRRCCSRGRGPGLRRRPGRSQRRRQVLVILNLCFMHLLFKHNSVLSTLLHNYFYCTLKTLSSYDLFNKCHTMQYLSNHQMNLSSLALAI